MTFYDLLTIATILIVALGYAITVWTRSIAFAIGLGLFYFWSLYGGWSIVTDRLGGESGKHYQYLYEKLFPIYLDRDYWRALVLYAAFIIIIEITVLFTVRRHRTATDIQPLARLSHVRLLSIATTAGLISYAIVRPALLAASTMAESGYEVTRTAGVVGTFFTIHQILNRVALDSLALGLVVLASPHPRYITAKRTFRWFVLYAIGLAAMFAFCLMLGNKNELFFAALFGGLLYIVNEKEPPHVRLAIGSVIALAAIMFVDFVRGLPSTQIGQNLRFENFVTSLKSAGSSNEAFGAHFSMYGALHFHVPLTYGSSLVSLAASVVPRAFWPDRPADIYGWYADHVYATPGQGYAIHHATGWYLNFGTPGVIAGAILFGLLWSGLFNGFCMVEKYRSLNVRLFFVLLPWTFTAEIPNVVRAGIEAYKGIAIDAVITPMAILIFAVYRRRARRRLPTSARRPSLRSAPQSV